MLQASPQALSSACGTLHSRKAHHAWQRNEQMPLDVILHKKHFKTSILHKDLFPKWFHSMSSQKRQRMFKKGKLPATTLSSVTMPQIRAQVWSML